MAFIIPHKSELIVDGQIIRQQLIENFKAIEQEESQLRDDLNDETDARINGDGKLQSQIDAIVQRLDKNEKNIADLQTRMSTAEEQIKKLNEIIFGYQYIDDTDLELLDDTPQPSEMEINDDVAIDDDTAEVAESIPDKAIDEVSQRKE